MSGRAPTEATIAELLDRALDAANRGDVATMHRLAGEVLAEDATNADAEELLACELPGPGELRRASIVFCDLVGSTELSGRQEPERYRGMMRRYKEECRRIIETRYDGHIVAIKGDGLLSLFGIPRAHGDDVERAVRAGLDIVEAVHQLSATTERESGESLDVRVAVHRGVIYLDRDDDDVYGLAVNVAARLESLADPGTVVVSEQVRELAEPLFVLAPRPAQVVKGVSEPLKPYLVTGERPVVVDRLLRAGADFVGRTAELGRLDAMWRAIGDDTADHPSAILLRGEAGIGKTRLAAAFTERVRGEGATVVELSGSSFHVETGFHPIRALIEQRARLVGVARGADRLEAVRRELLDLGLDPERLVPLLAPLLGIQPNAGYVPAASDARKLHEEVAEAAEEYLTACLAPGPAVLVVDDYQWFDESTRALVVRVTDHAPTPLLTIMTARPDQPAPYRVEVLDVGPLSTVDSHALLDALGTPALDDVRRALIARGDGVPLYLAELARATNDAQGPDAVAPRARRDDGPKDVDQAGGAVPDLLYELLMASLYATPEVAPVAAAAAAIGRDVDCELLAEVLDSTPSALEPTIETLLAEHVLERDAARGIRFRHELLREVAYELSPPTQLRQLHARIGDALLRRHAGNDVVDWAIVANHFDRAARPAAAADAFEQSAGEARRRGALDEARSNLGKAIESTARLPEGRARDRREVELRLQRGFLASSMEGNASTGAAEDYGRCLNLAGLDATDEEMFRTLIVLWAHLVSRGELARARQVLMILRPTLTGDREFWVPFNTAGFGMIDWFQGDFDRAQEQLEAAGTGDQIAGRDEEVESAWLNPMDPKASIDIHLALGRFVRGDLAGAAARVKDAAARAASLPFPEGPFSAAYVLAFTVWMRVESGDFDGADEAVQELSSLASRHGFDSWLLVAVTEETTVRALRALQAPDLDPDALRAQAGAIEGLIAAWGQFDIKVMLPFYWTTLGAVAGAAGDRDRARSHFESSLELAQSTGMRFYDAETLRRAAAVADTDADVLSGLRDALRTARAQGAHLFELRAALDLWERDATAHAADVAAAARHFPDDARYPGLDRARAVVVPEG